MFAEAPQLDAENNKSNEFGPVRCVTVAVSMTLPDHGENNLFSDRM